MFNIYIYIHIYNTMYYIKTIDHLCLAAMNRIYDVWDIPVSLHRNNTGIKIFLGLIPGSNIIRNVLVKLSHTSIF